MYTGDAPVDTVCHVIMEQGYKAATREREREEQRGICK